MTNFFSFDSTYSYEPVVKPIDPKLVERDLANFRRKILEGIKVVIDQNDLARSELSLTARICQVTAGKIYRGDLEKISTDRLLRVARRLGLKARVKFVADT